MPVAVLLQEHGGIRFQVNVGGGEVEDFGPWSLRLEPGQAGGCAVAGVNVGPQAVGAHCRICSLRHRQERWEHEALREAARAVGLACLRRLREGTLAHHPRHVGAGRRRGLPVEIVLLGWRVRILRDDVAGEVEAVLQSHPAISEAAVIGVSDPDLGEEIAAFVTIKPDTNPSAEEIIAFCRDRMAGYKYPRHIQGTARAQHL